MKKITSKEKRNLTLKKRYNVYRKLGYDSKTSRALSQRALDVSQLEISKRTGKLKRNTITKQFIAKESSTWKSTTAIDSYNLRMSEKTNDTVYSRWGMYTRDKRYKGETTKVISILKNRHKLSKDQAYYFLYFMNTNNMSYTEAKRQLLSNKEFEDYDKAKKQRQAKKMSDVLRAKELKKARKRSVN